MLSCEVYLPTKLHDFTTSYLPAFYSATFLSYDMRTFCQKVDKVRLMEDSGVVEQLNTRHDLIGEKVISQVWNVWNIASRESADSANSGMEHTNTFYTSQNSESS